MSARLLGVLFWAAVASACFGASSALAHEIRPAYLQLRQTAADRFDVLWKVPAKGESLRLGLHVGFPPGCGGASDRRGVFAGDAFTERWSMRCAGGLPGGTIQVEGLSATLTDVLVHVEQLDGTTQTARLTPSTPSFVVEAAPGRAEVVRTYLQLGVEHILTGADHLLFVLGLLLLVRGVGRLLKTVTAFTVAHSVTLTAATLGFVHVPQPPVETVIALSIVFVALELLRSGEASAAESDSLARRQPWLIAFTFGLLHGLGFAGGLREAGLPQAHIPLALALFSIGVELGHFAFIGAVLTAIASGRRALRRLPSKIRDTGRRVRLLPAYAIGTTAMFWVIQRIAAS